MGIIEAIAAQEAELAGWRRSLHAEPELDFDLQDTAAFVVERLREFGVDEIHPGIARTGVVGLIHGRAAGPTLGLRADMDALPIEEAEGRPWRSRRPGVMHACGHDGHTTILLGAARHLAATRAFAGSVAVIFQPSEELSAGARVMVEEGIMERFAIGSVFALHNVPGLDLGRIEMRPGPIMAAADQFEIVLRGRGGHAAFPHDCADPVAAAVALGQALIAIPARRVDPIAAAVLSLTTIQAGRATNVIPETATLSGTVRTLDAGVRTAMAEAVRGAAAATAAAHGVAVETRYDFGYPVTANHPAETALAARVATEVVGAARVDAARRPEMGAEDFAYMLEARPGAYVFLGTGPGAGLHHPAFDYNDAATPIGASYFVRLAETALPLQG